MNKPTGRERLVFALDVPCAADARRLVRLLSGDVGCFKVGLELFVAEGPSLVREVVREAPVFLDLKLHDIPATVGRAAAAAQKLGVRYLTVHATDGPEGATHDAEQDDGALRAAVDAMGPGVLAVTVLTSLSAETLGGPARVQQLVCDRALAARRAGCSGIVCSALEAPAARRVLGHELLIVAPGIRPRGASADDQQRIVTPQEAIEAGADLIVVGRPIRDAADPLAAARQIAAQLS
jgi:orotidine-5'-phosphate decarboxylase